MNMSVFSSMPLVALCVLLYFGWLGVQCVRGGGSVGIQLDKINLTFRGQSEAK